MAVASVEIDLPSGQSIPTSLFGYTVLGYLARGAGSVLYYARHPKRGGIFVLKHVTVTTERDKRYYEQLRTEYLLGRRVNHPGVRRSVEMRVRRTWFKGVTEAALLMEHCDGYTLEERVPADNTERVCVFLRAAMAVAALNDAGYVHCDLKPGNIVVKAVANATVIDLGQACRIGTVKERVQGTVNFIAPEQAKCRAVTPRTDVYCFGATMYMALTKTPLPTVMNVEKKQVKMLEGLTKPPHAVDASVPPDLSSLVMDCVRTDPDYRPADMHEVVTRLKAAGVNAMRRAGALAQFDKGGSQQGKRP